MSRSQITVHNDRNIQTRHHHYYAIGIMLAVGVIALTVAFGSKYRQADQHLTAHSPQSFTTTRTEDSIAFAELIVPLQPITEQSENSDTLPVVVGAQTSATYSNTQHSSSTSGSVTVNGTTTPFLTTETAEPADSSAANNSTTSIELHVESDSNVTIFSQSYVGNHTSVFSSSNTWSY